MKVVYCGNESRVIAADVSQTHSSLYSPTPPPIIHTPNCHPLPISRRQSDVTFTNVTLTEEEEEGEEVVYLTPEQIQYFTDALRTGRKKRKVEQFNKFVTKWPLPIEYTFDGTHGKGAAIWTKKKWFHDTLL